MKRCAYPTAKQVDQHGLQPLPEQLEVVSPFREGYGTTPGRCLSGEQWQEMVRVVATAFASREPMTRHLTNISRYAKEELLRVFLEVCLLPKRDVRQQSLVMLDDLGKVIGGAFNETLDMNDTPPLVIRSRRLLAAMDFLEPIFKILGQQQKEGMRALVRKYRSFEIALNHNLVGHHFMVARSDRLTAARARYLVGGTAAWYRKLGFQFMVVEATHSWTGAVCEELGGTRVHYLPYRTASIYPSADGYLSDIDSGTMLYVLRLQ